MNLVQLLQTINQEKLFKISQLKIYCEYDTFSEAEKLIIEKKLLINLEQKKLEYFEKIFRNVKSFDESFYSRYFSSIDDTKEGESVDIKILVKDDTDRQILEDI